MTYTSHRLLQTSALSIALSLSLDVSVETYPPAVYVDDSQSRLYTSYLMWTMAVLHIAIVIAIVIVLLLGLKVMLLVSDALNAVNLLYILSGLGMYGSSLLSH